LRWEVHDVIAAGDRAPTATTTAAAAKQALTDCGSTLHRKTTTTTTAAGAGATATSTTASTTTKGTAMHAPVTVGARVDVLVRHPSVHAPLHHRRHNSSDL
jgi:hypothetical protein